MESWFIEWVKEHVWFWALGPEGVMRDAWAGVPQGAQKSRRERGMGHFYWPGIGPGHIGWDSLLPGKATVGVNTLSL